MPTPTPAPRAGACRRRSLRCSALALVFAAAAGVLAAALPPGFSVPAEKDARPARLDPREPDPRLEFPANARTRGIGEGMAVVSVAVDEQGRATDAVLVACSDPVFGRALLDGVKSLKFEPALCRGRAVAGACEVGYKFQFHSAAGGDHGFGFSAWGTTTGGLQVGGALPVDITDIFSGKSLRQRPALAPVPESQLDRPLEFTEVALPRLPAGYPASPDHPTKVFVSFFIDEAGRVRAPRVESDTTPELAERALRVVRTWAFKPPVAKGRAVIVQTARPVGFVPRAD